MSSSDPGYPIITTNPPMYIEVEQGGEVRLHCNAEGI